MECDFGNKNKQQKMINLLNFKTLILAHFDKNELYNMYER